MKRCRTIDHDPAAVVSEPTYTSGKPMNDVTEAESVEDDVEGRTPTTTTFGAMEIRKAVPLARRNHVASTGASIEEALTAALAALVRLPATVESLQARVDQLEDEVDTLRGGDPDQLLDTAQAAQMLKMSKAAVRQAARRGSLPAVYCGRRLRFRRGQLVLIGRHE